MEDHDEFVRLQVELAMARDFNRRLLDMLEIDQRHAEDGTEEELAECATRIQLLAEGGRDV